MAEGYEPKPIKELKKVSNGNVALIDNDNPTLVIIRDTQVNSYDYCVWIGTNCAFTYEAYNSQGACFAFLGRFSITNGTLAISELYKKNLADNTPATVSTGYPIIRAIYQLV